MNTIKFEDHSAKFAKVSEALHELEDHHCAARHGIPSIVHYSHIRSGRVPISMRKADFSAVLSNSLVVFIRVATEFRTRPTKRRMREIIRRAKENGLFTPTIIVFAGEKISSIVKKVAGCIKIFIDYERRVFNWKRFVRSMNSHSGILTRPAIQHTHFSYRACA
jgi:hypothetical protein